MSLNFNQWEKKVDKLVQRVSGGLSTLDFADYPSRDCYDDELSPEEALEVLCDYDDIFAAMYSMYLEEKEMAAPHRDRED